MSRIKGKDTKPELIVRSLLHSMGYRYRLHQKSLPGKPDLVLKKYRTVIFVHGCFWHRHEDCRYAYNPKSKVDFWEKKFQKNIERDRIKTEQLKESGWSVLVIWECETKNRDKLIQCLQPLIESKET